MSSLLNRQRDEVVGNHKAGLMFLIWFDTQSLGEDAAVSLENRNISFKEAMKVAVQNEVEIISDERAGRLRIT